MPYPISIQQPKEKKLIYQTNKEKQTNENKLIGRIIKMDRHVCSGFDLQRKSRVNLLPPHLEISHQRPQRGGVKGTKRKRKKRLERKRGGGEMDNQQIESFQIKQRCKVNREIHTLSTN